MSIQHLAFSNCVASCSKESKDVGALTDAKNKMADSEVLNRTLAKTLSLLELLMSRMYGEEAMCIVRHK